MSEQLSERRPTRTEPGGVFHVTARGNNRMDLFRDEVDYKVYMNMLKNTQKKYPFILHAYCLMNNHVHLMIETIDHPLCRIMQSLHSKYPRFVHRKYNCSGHVFDRRYHANILETPHDMMMVSTYIHLNPFRAQIVDRVDLFTYSSIAAYISNTIDPYVNTRKILSLVPSPVHHNYFNFLKSYSRSQQARDERLKKIEAERRQAEMLEKEKKKKRRKSAVSDAGEVAETDFEMD